MFLPRNTAPRAPVIAIVGGGFSGAAVAWHLARRLPASAAAIRVIEPRAELGHGLAYGTTDPDHRLNVPDDRMSLRSDDPLHFQRWLASAGAPLLPGGSATRAGQIFAPRAVFGRYVAAQMAPLLAGGRVEHLRDRVLRIEAGTRFTLHPAEGAPFAADLVVLAVSHPAPALPAELAGLRGSATLVEDAALPGALAAIPPQERVLIVGSGLTAADIVATLMRQGQRGPVHILSRHGWLSQPHGPKQAETAADFGHDPARTALALFRRVRAALAEDAARGLTWHAVFDRLRAQGPAIWAALPLPERRRLLRHLRALWDIHRFRIAPQTHDTLREAVRAGRVFLHTARLVGVEAAARGRVVTIRRRGGARTARLAVDRVILATGPAHGGVIRANPALASLQAQGVLRPDPLGLGIATAPDGRVLGAEGPVEGLFVAGPLARGTVGELMGLPEVTLWAEHVAAQIAGALAARPEVAGT